MTTPPAPPASFGLGTLPAQPRAERAPRVPREKKEKGAVAPPPLPRREGTLVVRDAQPAAEAQGMRLVGITSKLRGQLTVEVADSDHEPASLFWAYGQSIPATLDWKRGNPVYFWVNPGLYHVTIRDTKGHEETHVAEVRMDDEERSLVPSPIGEMWIRATGTSDPYTITEAIYPGLKFQEDDVVMDIGAHIGVFSRRALLHGASAVHAYEAEPGNFEILKLNLTGYPATAVRGAVTSNETGYIDLQVNTGSCTTIHSTRRTHTRGRAVVPTPVVDFQTEIQQVQPTVVKLDIEGGEYWLDMTFPDSVRTIAMELDRSEDWLQTKAPALVDKVNSQGFTPLKPPHFEAGKYMQTVVWER